MWCPWWLCVYDVVVTVCAGCGWLPPRAVIPARCARIPFPLCPHCEYCFFLNKFYSMIKIYIALKYKNKNKQNVYESCFLIPFVPKRARYTQEYGAKLYQQRVFARRWSSQQSIYTMLNPLVGGSCVHMQCIVMAGHRPVQRAFFAGWRQRVRSTSHNRA